MNGLVRQEVWRPIFGVLLFACLAVSSYPQSQALDGQIEGTVSDENHWVIANASITAVNVQTGLRRVTPTNEDGVFRFPFLSLGLYTIIVENPGFKRFERLGITLAAGQTVSIDIVLQPGPQDETVSIFADAAIADDANAAVGRRVNSREIAALPLVSRNPYNFMLQQPGVTGRQVKDPFVINLSVNGLRRRVGYQLDGGYNNDSNQSGSRLTFVSEIFVKEVQLLSGGYSAEFGNTAGAIVNIITPAGTNDRHGVVSFLFRPAELSSKPFGFQSGLPSPNVYGYGVTATFGGPIISDRWHFYSGYEWVRRRTVSLISVTDANRQLLIGAGLRPSIFSNTVPTRDILPYFIFRTDAMISDRSRISFRYNRFDAGLRNSISAGLNTTLNTTERSTDTTGYDHAFAGQAVKAYSEMFFNELRFQYAGRVARMIPNEFTAPGPSVSISNVANFGPDPLVGSVTPNESTMQFQDAITKVFTRHSIKAGGGINFIRDQPTSEISARYIFSSVSDFDAARSGINRRAYSQYQETFGDSVIPYHSFFANFFVQDDWRFSAKLKVAFGLRYELYLPPSADSDSPLPYSKSFRTDWNNFAPRLGLVYLFRDGNHRLVLRAGSGFHYDPPLLTMYRRAILNNGNPRYFSFSFQPGTNGAPDFPNRVGTFPAGTIVPDVDAVSPDFKTMFATHSNLQLEMALTDNMSVTAGFLYSTAKHIPVYRNVNCRPTGGTLADGRPVYGTFELDSSGNVTIRGCSDPITPRFRRINMAESVGDLDYRALFLQLNKRFSRGFQLAANYTLARSLDDAPEDNGPLSLTQSDPSNRAFDLGNSAGDVRSAFSMSLVARPEWRISNHFLRRLIDHNQLSMIVLADSGETFNITSTDLNLDGVVGPDRPVGVPRNSGRLPAFFSADARFLRSFRIDERSGLELYVEATNIFNTRQVSGFSGTTLSGNNIYTSLVNPLTGVLRGPLPDFRNLAPTWRDSRQIQLGARFQF